MMVQQYKKEMWRCMFWFLKKCDEILDFHSLTEHITQPANFGDLYPGNLIFK